MEVTEEEVVVMEVMEMMEEEVGVTEVIEVTEEEEVVMQVTEVMEAGLMLIHVVYARIVRYLQTPLSEDRRNSYHCRCRSP
jgi:hypothetical protein